MKLAQEQAFQESLLADREKVCVSLAWLARAVDTAVEEIKGS